MYSEMSVTTKERHLVVAQQPSVATTDESGRGHWSVFTHREQSQRLAESERYFNSCQQLPCHCMAIEICIVWYAYVGNCLFQFYMTVILLSVYVTGWNLVDYHNTTVC